MEKTLTVDGKQVNFKSTAATPRIYRTQFGGVDFFQDVAKLMPLMSATNSKDTEFEDMTQEQLETFNFEIFENIIWVLAKTADRTIPEPIEWLGQFDSIDFEYLLPELMVMMTNSFEGKKKNHPATKK